MADRARDIIQQKHRQIPVKINAVKLSEHEAFGNGSGIMWAHTVCYCCFVLWFR